MKKVFEIYKNDWKRIFSSYAAIIVVLALCILPSLYAWFNIKASWDPYSEEATGGIKIGVVNKDTGADLRGKEVNVGEEVVAELKDNKQMGWQFVSEEEAKKAVEEGTYYATITIPENFSKDLTSIASGTIQKGTIIYTVNEKINAIAPKITDKGATALQENVSKAVVETVSDAIFGLGNEIGIQLENQIPNIETIYNALTEVQSNFERINNTVDSTYEGAEKLDELIKSIENDIPMINETLINAQNLSGNIQEFVGESKGAIEKITPTIKQDIKIISEIADDIDTNIEALINAINSGSDKAPEIIDNLITKVDGLKDITNSLIKVLKTLNNFTPGRPLTPLIDKLKSVNAGLDEAIQALNNVKETIANGEKPDLTILNRVQEIARDIAGMSDDLYGKFDTDIMPQINNILDGTYSLAQEALVILKEAESKLPRVQEVLGIALDSISAGKDALAKAKEVLPEGEALINELVEKLAKVKDEQDLLEVVDLLKADVQQRSDFLANPVNIEENKLFQMQNYGTGMTPFYTVLSLWVGILLLVSILSVGAHGEYKATEVYFGKLLLFLTISTIQGLVVALGDLYLLKIYCVNPTLFILGSIFTSMTFTFIVYSLVSVFGNVGKVIAIILLVLQVAGSGGTFPIQLTPKFFQVINPFLPFTYLISFAREAIGGVVNTVLMKDIVISSIYIIVSVLIAVLLKKPINKLSQGFVKSFEKSKIGEH